MKKVTWLVIGLFMAGNAFSQTLFTYGPYSVDAHEFVAAHNKNKTPVKDVKASLENYLDLYIVFKLKVQAAKDKKVDTLPAQKADLQRFRSQIISNFLWDSAKVQSLLDEAIRRSKKDIQVTALKIATSPEDAASLEMLAKSAVPELNKHEIREAELLKKWKAKGVPVSKENLGYITVFTLPHNLENIVYGLRSGTYSEPVQIGNNLYIFKNVQERPAVGTIELAQILIASPEGPNSDRPRAKILSDSLYQLILHGADFGNLAKQFSNDRSTYMNDGKMAPFGVGKYSPEFEEHAFSLHKDGEVTPPFTTAYGYHILKRIGAHPVSQQPDDEFIYKLRQELFADPRIDTAREILIRKVKPELGFTQHDFNIEDLWKVSDSSMLTNRGITVNGLNYKTVLFSFADSSEVKVGEWDTFLRNSGKIRGDALHDTYRELWPLFMQQVVLDDYKNHIQEFSLTFAHQLNDFKEGNMLFEMMQQKVWLKAARDSAGLRNYFEQHTSHYKWEKSVDAITISCTDSMTAQQVAKKLAAGTKWSDLMQLFPAKVQADSGRFEFSQMPGLQGQDPEVGKLTPMVVNPQDGTITFTKILKVYPAGMQRSFEDARGLVVNDYQKELENEWVEKLKKEYPVKVNKSVFKSIVSQVEKQ